MWGGRRATGQVTYFIGFGRRRRGKKIINVTVVQCYYFFILIGFIIII